MDGCGHGDEREAVVTGRIGGVAVEAASTDRDTTALPPPRRDKPEEERRVRETPAPPLRPPDSPIHTLPLPNEDTTSGEKIGELGVKKEKKIR